MQNLPSGRLMHFLFGDSAFSEQKWNATKHRHVTILNCSSTSNFTVGIARTEQGSHVKIFNSTWRQRCKCLLWRTLLRIFRRWRNISAQKSLVSSRRERTQQAILKGQVNGKKTLLQVKKMVQVMPRARIGIKFSAILKQF